MFADHIGNLTVELVLASAEVTNYGFLFYCPHFNEFLRNLRQQCECVSAIQNIKYLIKKISFLDVAQVTTLTRRRHPSLKTLNTLLEVQPFPGLEPESKL